MSLLASNFYPTAEELFASGKDPMLELRRSPRSMFGLLFTALGLFILVSIICYFFGHLRFSEDIPVLNLISTYWFFIFPIGYAVESVRRYHDDLYLLEKNTITHQGGRLSLQYAVPVIKYIDIRAIGVSQSFTGRIFDYGDVELNTSALDSGEMIVEGVRAPDALSRLIEQIRTHHERLAEKEIA